MPADHSRKTAIRQYMAATGDSYYRAAKAVDHARLLAALAPPPPCDGVSGHNWDCPQACPACETPLSWTRDELGRADELYVCTGRPACEDLDCFNGCNDHFVRMCHDCLYVFGVDGGDPRDGSCPNGCR
ncbi:hypothetical protein J7F03_21505 [Streptomyces sp. ISL-43]|uniref:hypothetical protein n=1 Tax=Streptomyces sp. ISL-43 TaxID=2819183 RepID=UPI001BEADDFF|nr:hypothetical protein [Streptomyces sp. ISL-43]MBT2449610.1 hypothetical protein [Streptomyces sp. ISL-43]